MLSPTSDTLRLFLHVLAAAIWVGGQIAVGGIVPAVRAVDGNATKVVARAFNRVAWPAFAILVATGLWNLAEVNLSSQSDDYKATVMAHIGLAAVSGAFAAVHVFAKTKAMIALGAALGVLAALGALFIGILLRTHG